MDCERSQEWQKFFAEELQKLGFRRLMSDGNVYVHMVLTVIMLVFADDLMVFGVILHIQEIFQKVIPSFLYPGDRSLKRGQSQRSIHRTRSSSTGDGILIYRDHEHCSQILRGFDLIDCPATSTTVIHSRFIGTTESRPTFTISSCCRKASVGSPSETRLCIHHQTICKRSK